MSGNGNSPRSSGRRSSAPSSSRRRSRVRVEAGVSPLASENRIRAADGAWSLNRRRIAGRGKSADGTRALAGGEVKTRRA
jgi:hypothetical protein